MSECKVCQEFIKNETKLDYKINKAGTIAYVDEREAIDSSKKTFRFLMHLAKAHQPRDKKRENNE